MRNRVSIMMLKGQTGGTQTRIKPHPPVGDLRMIEEDDVVPRLSHAGPPAVPSPGWGSILAYPPPVPCSGLFIRSGLLEWML